MAEGKRKVLDLEQQRAAFAWRKVENETSDYANLAKSAPALIMSNGLMQTLAFFESKEKSYHHKALSEHVCSWLSEQGFSKSKSGQFREVMEYLHGSQSEKYRRATEEALALLRWIRQFASALTTKD